MKIGPVKLSWILFAFVPISAGLEFMHASPIAIFACSCLAVLPLAGLMGHATEALAVRLGPGIGGLLNATFGNAVELIIALMALHRGLHEVVKASITGSIIGNALLVLGLSVLVGGIKHERQKFNSVAASLGATLLALSAAGLLAPAIFHAVVTPVQVNTEHHLSLAISIVLMTCYLLSMLFQLMTHRHLFEEESGSVVHAEAGSVVRAEEEAPWSMQKAILALLGATLLVGMVSEFLIGAVEHTAKTFGMSSVFVGVIVLAIIGNAAEHSTAVLMALKNQMDLAMNIAIGSSIQVALFVAPALVFASYAFGHPLDLLFTPFEIVAVVMTVFILSLVANDGESHWMEGVLLLAVYLIFGIAFFFLPETAIAVDAAAGATAH